jgi:hypothetical protein
MNQDTGLFWRVLATPQLLKVVFLLRPTTPALFFLYD